ncbi:MAG: L-2-amino-thiazoline-4-carboxylic acid hydrolase [Bacillota bacterium]|nr:L-2-amino-thiazoline-4-carboxylic acid hydrolase [Eubacteriales bacterium]MDI9492152.1 L-2-amino-thiazoline-4-carboxylic acid hydrolase [Bacillota bacterium]NLV70306.1 hypothetical protein [Clostridiales bacterium]MDD3537964.1 L-2-amino-thiazoline-4-carboxylic acid hydrolase [Eubacteriales bacterium]MDD4285686.1 L-2-amino-thiazoline-4-carboxylic acid hydrolase [Eubacteriales bacterium]
MRTFSELTHAWIVGVFYRELKKAFKERGVRAFVHMTMVYAEQRGSRMAQRAIRDGKPLDFASYRTYGEWQSTETASEIMGGFQSRVLSVSPDHEEHIDRCPWAWQFDQMGLRECGVVYCTHLDRAIARGFNPYITFDVPQSVNDHDCCIQIMREAGFEEGQVFTKDPANIRDFEYHCGHVYKVFALLSGSVFGPEGKAIADKVLEMFRAEYGPATARVLEKHMETDFLTI